MPRRIHEEEPNKGEIKLSFRVGLKLIEIE